jgi:hypothetical protein
MADNIGFIAFLWTCRIETASTRAYTVVQAIRLNTTVVGSAHWFVTIACLLLTGSLLWVVRELVLYPTEGPQFSVCEESANLTALYAGRQEHW